jgi:hypothetical protein
MEPEAVAIKQHRRRLERRWKKHGEESNQLAYRAVCRRSNELINASRNRFRYQHVLEAGKDSRRVYGQQLRTFLVPITLAGMMAAGPIVDCQSCAVI